MTTNPPSSHPLVRVEDLEVRYGEQRAVAGLSFAIQPGEVLALLGPNGAGKSSTVRCLLGLQEPSAGALFLGPYNIQEAPKEAKRLAAYVPEHGSLYELLTPRETLQLHGRLHGLDEATIAARSEHLLGHLGLAARLDDPVLGFSKGMRQKLVLACALLTEPQVLILDEPLSGLDAETTLVVKELLRQLRARGCAILYCSHLLDVVESVADRVLILREGQSVAEGALDELLAAEQQGEARIGLADLFRTRTESADPELLARKLLELPGRASQ
jgi:ABC-2 type transport system ATP-binding protein